MASRAIMGAVFGTYISVYGIHRNIVTIDWTMRENVRAQLRVIIKRILRKYGYPPDKQEKATQTVLEQVELLGWEVAA